MDRLSARVHGFIGRMKNKFDGARRTIFRCQTENFKPMPDDEDNSCIKPSSSSCLTRSPLTADADYKHSDVEETSFLDQEKCTEPVSENSVTPTPAYLPNVASAELSDEEKREFKDADDDFTPRNAVKEESIAMKLERCSEEGHVDETTDDSWLQDDDRELLLQASQSDESNSSIVSTKSPVVLSAAFGEEDTEFKMEILSDFSNTDETTDDFWTQDDVRQPLLRNPSLAEFTLGDTSVRAASTEPHAIPSEASTSIADLTEFIDESYLDLEGLVEQDMTTASASSICNVPSMLANGDHLQSPVQDSAIPYYRYSTIERHSLGEAKVYKEAKKERDEVPLGNTPQGMLISTYTLASPNFDSSSIVDSFLLQCAKNYTPAPFQTTSNEVDNILDTRPVIRHPLICDNCNHSGHRWYHCIEPCVLCDSPGHASPACKRVLGRSQGNEKKRSNKRKLEDEYESASSSDSKRSRR